MTEVWYRYVDYRESTGGVDVFGDPLPGSRAKIFRRELSVIRRTPKGVWLQDYSRERFVKIEANKRFAHPTDQEALASFLARKKRQALIYATRHTYAKEALALGARKYEAEYSASPK